MTRPYQPIDARRIRLYSIQERRHRASVRRAASLPLPGASAFELLASFPDSLVTHEDGATEVAN